MNKHLTDQQLIDYQFKLASEPDLEEAHLHLDGCDQCRQRLAALVRKFAALDLLRDEVKVPEHLLSQTVENATQVRRTRVIWLYRVPALGAVAAAVIAGAALLLVSHLGPDQRVMPTLAPGPAAPNVIPGPVVQNESVPNEEQPMSFTAKGVGQAELASKPKSLSFDMRQPLAEQSTAGRVGLAPPEPMSMSGGSAKAENPVRSVPVRAFKKTPDGVTTNALAAAPVAKAEQVAEKPPFAPASAIELVVMPRRENVQLTIYNGADLTLVRERRNLTLKQGWNWLQFMWANTLIDPTSLSLEPLEHKDAVQVQQLVFPPRLRELGRWLIHSDMNGQVPFELTYFTSGLAWRAFYLGTLSQDEKTMHLESYVRIANDSGEDYEDAQTRLVVGRVHLLDQIAYLALRQYPYGSPVPPQAFGGGGRASGFASNKDVLGQMVYSPSTGPALESLERKMIEKEGLSEYFLYTIEGTETIPDRWGKRLLSFQADGIPVTSLYKYDEERWGTQAIQFLSFANDAEHKLGQTPLPDGTVRVYGQADGQGHLSYVGAMGVKYIPVGEKVELNLGPARLVEVKPVLMDYTAANHTFDSKGNLSGWDEVRTWRVEMTNTRPLPVEVEVTRGFGTANWTLKAADQSVSYEKYDATHARFKVTLDAQSKRSFEYTVTTYCGVRREALVTAQ